LLNNTRTILPLNEGARRGSFFVQQILRALPKLALRKFQGTQANNENQSNYSITIIRKHHQ
jgi:hypothetical protein